VRRLAVIVALAAGFAAGATPAAQARLACDDGATVLAEGRMRILAKFFDTPDETGSNHWACLGRARRPLLVGGSVVTPGTASGDTPAYAFGGGRYVGALNLSDGEGGPSSDVTVYDLRRRRVVAFVNLACCEGTPAFRVARDGTAVVLARGVGLLVKRPGRRAIIVLTDRGFDLAMAGDTVYWSERGQPRSDTLEWLSGRQEARMLEPVRARSRARGPCPAARGRTVVASGSVRVVERAGARRRIACRAGSARRIDAGRAGAAAPRIVADRWLLVVGEGRARVADTRSGLTVTRAASVARATLLLDGTLAWIDVAGRALAQAPGAAPVVGAAAGARARAAAPRAL
jgi:hypothetical protein